MPIVWCLPFCPLFTPDYISLIIFGPNGNFSIPYLSGTILSQNASLLNTPVHFPQSTKSLSTYDKDITLWGSYPYPCCNWVNYVGTQIFNRPVKVPKTRAVSLYRYRMIWSLVYGRCTLGKNYMTPSRMMNLCFNQFLLLNRTPKSRYFTVKRDKILS